MTAAFFGFDEEDTRTVQTAVRGGPDSGIPEFLPYEKHAANRLREKYGPNAFSCGLLLGGCGKLLTLRACDDKKSHFAHRPPVRCNRSARGENSADHLYIGEALGKWLRAQSRPNIAVNYVKQTSARSDTIEIRFGSKKKKRLIHVQMARRSFKEWQQDGTRLSAPAGKPSTLRMYGPESQLSAFELEVTGHALRFRCETVNGTRVVHIGTHLPGHRVEWTTLDRCRLTPAGIVTPWLEETPYGIRPKGTTTPLKPAASAAGTRTPSPVVPASAPTPVQEPKRGAAAATSAPAGPALPLKTGSLAFTGAVLLSEENGRRVYDVDAQPVGSALFRARISLPSSIAAPEPHHVYVLTERAAVLGGPQSGDPASRWTLRAEGHVRLPAQRAAEWELLTPPAPVSEKPADAREAREGWNGASSEAVSGSAEREPAPWPQPRPDPQEAPVAPSAGPPPPAPSPDDRLAAELGRVLLKTARAGATITWHELLKQTGTRPQDVSETRQVRLLTAVDAPQAKARKPLLSSLVTFSRQAQPNDAAPPFFRQVLLALGWPHWTDAARAADIHDEHRRRLHRASHRLSARHEAAESGPESSAPPVAREGEGPRTRLLALLRHLDVAGAELSLLNLYRMLGEADRLVSRIGEPSLPDTVVERLHHWRSTYRSRTGTPAVRGRENPKTREDSERIRALDAEARELFDHMADEFRAARAAGDLARAEQVRGDMGPVYALRLSPRDREELTGVMREFKQWIRDREPKPPAGTAQGPLRLLADRVRAVLQDVARAGTTITWEDLRHRVGGETPFLHSRHREEILTTVDRDTPADEPLLSALVAGADLAPDGLYPHIRHSLGRERVPDPSIEMHWRMDVLRLHQLWRHR
ncbi:competence protein CoiA family protein [Streptomyces prasinus]|uniref:competence protein CoiA family protein n=1 Tax=Streptomyces prasinus TaxID=67345 RepID=UPI0033AA9ED9